MNAKEKASRILKKEYFEFKKHSIEESKKLTSGLANIFSEEQYLLVDVPTCSQFQFSLSSESLLFKDFRVTTEVASVELEGEKCDVILNIDPSKIEYDLLLFVIPDVWIYCGGFALAAESLFANFDRISYVLEDSFCVFSLKNKTSFFKFQGDRSGGRLSYCDIVRSGEEFSRLL